VIGWSGRPRNVSSSKRAGTAIAPVLDDSTSSVVIITVCKSDAVTVNKFWSSWIKKFYNIGMIGLLAITPLIPESCFNKTDEDTTNFICVGIC
jgi:hypothetical protein